MKQKEESEGRFCKEHQLFKSDEITLDLLKKFNNQLVYDVVAGMLEARHYDKITSIYAYPTIDGIEEDMFLIPHDVNTKLIWSHGLTKVDHLGMNGIHASIYKRTDKSVHKSVMILSITTNKSEHIMVAHL